MRQEYKSMLPQISNGNKSIDAIYEYVANTIIVNVRQISDELGLSFSGVTKVVKAFEEVGILRQATHKERYRQFGYAPVLVFLSMSDNIRRSTMKECVPGCANNDSFSD